jgi:LacI family transcriptional regulator
VSAYLNNTPGISVSEENRAAIVSAIRELNYTVNVQAKSIKTGRSQCIAVYGDVYNALLLQLVEGISQESGPAGYHVLMYGGGCNLEAREGLISLYREGRIDGIITLDFPDPLKPQWEQSVLECGVPYVSVEGMPGAAGISSVGTDYGSSMEEALEFLWERTGAAPLYLNVLPAGRTPTAGDRERVRAYRDWMKERTLEPQVLDILEQAWDSRESWWREWLDRQPKPLVILSNWSRGAVFLYRLAYEQGLRIGADLFVMSGDDTERISRHMVPPIPCVEVPYVDMGRRAFKLLEELLQLPGGAGGPRGPVPDGQEPDGAEAQQEMKPARKEIVPCKLFRALK